MRKRYSDLLLSVVVTTVLGGVTVTPSSAATLSVAAGAVVVAGDSLCSLREAIENAEANATTHADCAPVGAYGNDVIELAATTYSIADGPYVASGANGLPVITNAQSTGTLVIQGHGATIERAALAPAFRLLQLGSGAEVTIHSLILRNGQATGANLNGDGAGILNRGGDLTLHGVTLSDNAAFGSGGGLRTSASGTTAIHDSTIGPNNSAATGGGILNGEPHTLHVHGSLITGNSAVGSGGGLYNFAAAELTCTTVSNNEAGSGGGIAEGSTATILLSQSSVLSNRALDGPGGGIYNGGILNFNNLGTLGLVARNSTIALNSALESGGGIFNESANAFLFNSTIAGNTADSSNTGVGDGGGIAQVGSFFNAGGLFLFPAQLQFRNTIVADNVDRTGEAPDCIDVQAAPLTPALESHGYNLIEDTSGCTITPVSNPGTDVTGQDPNLGPLLNPATQCSPTLCPAPSSPAIEGGNPTACVDQNGQTLTSDQRGIVRPLDGDEDGIAICDIGACEFGIAKRTSVPVVAPGGLAVLVLALLSVARRATRE